MVPLKACGSTSSYGRNASIVLRPSTRPRGTGRAPLSAGSPSAAPRPLRCERSRHQLIIHDASKIEKGKFSSGLGTKLGADRPTLRGASSARPAAGAVPMSDRISAGVSHCSDRWDIATRDEHPYISHDCEERSLAVQFESFAGSSPSWQSGPGHTPAPLKSGPYLGHPIAEIKLRLYRWSDERSRCRSCWQRRWSSRIISSSAWALLLSSFLCFIRTTSASCSASRRSQPTTSPSNCLNSSRSGSLNIIRNTALKNGPSWGCK
jgi:hypothetical protein